MCGQRVCRICTRSGSGERRGESDAYMAEGKVSGNFGDADGRHRKDGTGGWTRTSYGLCLYGLTSTGQTGTVRRFHVYSGRGREAGLCR